MKSLYAQLHELAFRPGYDAFRSYDIPLLLQGVELEDIGSGFFSRVRKPVGQDYVIKEGKWDLDMPVFHNLSIKMPATSLNNLLKLFSVEFLPSQEEITRQYRFYEAFKSYFGYDGTDDEKKFRDSLEFVFEVIANRLYATNSRIES